MVIRGRVGNVVPAWCIGGIAELEAGGDDAGCAQTGAVTASAAITATPLRKSFIFLDLPSVSFSLTRMPEAIVAAVRSVWLRTFVSASHTDPIELKLCNSGWPRFVG